MIIFKDPAEITVQLSGKVASGISIGFVPTMGALHSGHLSLIQQAREENSLVAVSIFVNPTQFNDRADFEKYPQTIEKDIYLLERSGCDVLFLPTVQGIYPEGLSNVKERHYDLGYLETELEGRYRPGHFQGVCQVVHRLLDIVKPQKLYLGQKDLQQCMVLKRLIHIIGAETSVVICPTKREPDGLAMSSRNLRLDPVQRQLAPAIYKMLNRVKRELLTADLSQLRAAGINTLTDKGFKVDYVEIAKAADLRTAHNENRDEPLVVLVAAYLNEVRLIDNLMLGISPV